MTQQITILATIHARAGREADVEARMRIMVEASRKEAGCLRYDMHRAEDDGASFIMVEYWASAQALGLHDDSAHMAALRADLPHMLDRPIEVRRLVQVF